MKFTTEALIYELLTRTEAKQLQLESYKSPIDPKIKQERREYYQLIIDTINLMLEDHNKETRAQYIRGLDAGRKESQPSRFDKEKHRDQHAVDVRKKWGGLF